MQNINDVGATFSTVIHKFDRNNVNSVHSNKIWARADKTGERHKVQNLSPFKSGEISSLLFTIVLIT